MATLLFVLLSLLILSVPLYFIRQRVIREIDKKRFKDTPFPSEWSTLLEREYPLYNHLPQELKDDLHYKIQIFLAEKKFEGCNGFKITQEIKLLVAAQACTLIINRKHDVFPKLVSILIYPSTYVAKSSSYDSGIITNSETSVAGQSSTWGGQITLAWNHVEGGVTNMADGDNVVFHEFAHQLDGESGDTNGVPKFDKGKNIYHPWVEIVGEEFYSFVDRVHHHHKDVIDDYGATNAAEFFAVTTETFFEKPNQLAKKHPKLYDEFKDYYQLDPRDWFN